eukprot:PhF_6_TR33885/c0_g1_i1/m.49725
MSEEFVDFHKLYLERHGIHEAFEIVCNRLVQEQPKTDTEVTEKIVTTLHEIREERINPRVHVYFVFGLDESECGTHAKNVSKTLGVGFIDAKPILTEHNHVVNTSVNALKTALQRNGHQIVIVANFPPTIRHATRFECSIYQPRRAIYCKLPPSAIQTKRGMSEAEALKDICKTVNPVAEYYSGVGKLESVDALLGVEEYVAALTKAVQ